MPPGVRKLCSLMQGLTNLWKIQLPQCFFLSLSLCALFYFFALCRKFGSPYLGKSSVTHSYQSAVFLCVQTMVWLPAFGIFNVHVDVDAGDSTQGLYGHRKRVSTESWLGWKIPCHTNNIAPGFSVERATNWAAMPPSLLLRCGQPLGGFTTRKPCILNWLMKLPDERMVFSSVHTNRSLSLKSWRHVNVNLLNTSLNECWETCEGCKIKITAGPSYIHQ